jgi:hypothetical protein
LADELGFLYGEFFVGFDFDLFGLLEGFLADEGLLGVRLDPGRGAER